MNNDQTENNQSANQPSNVAPINNDNGMANDPQQQQPPLNTSIDPAPNNNGQFTNPDPMPITPVDETLSSNATANATSENPQSAPNTIEQNIGSIGIPGNIDNANKSTDIQAAPPATVIDPINNNQDPNEASHNLDQPNIMAGAGPASNPMPTSNTAPVTPSQAMPGDMSTAKPGNKKFGLIVGILLVTLFILTALLLFAR